MLATISSRFQNLIGYFRPSAGNGSSNNNSDGNGRSAPTAYRYVPNNEQHYFADSFILGSEKFETLLPETFLFGENADLNFLNPEPLQVPFNLSMELSPVYPIRSLIHVRRDTIRLVRNPSAPQSYRIEFFFDCDVPVEITLRCLVRESIISNSGGQLSLNYNAMNEQYSTMSPVYRFPNGGAQLFSKSDWSFTPSDWPSDSWLLTADHASATQAVPIVARCRTVTPSTAAVETAPVGSTQQPQRRSLNQQQSQLQQSQQNQQPTPLQEHIVLIGLEKSSTGDGSYHLKTVRQKLLDNGCGCVFLLHELYGAENKQINNAAPPTTTTTAAIPPPTAAAATATAAKKLDEQNSSEPQGSSGDVSLSDTSTSTAVAPAPVPVPAPAPAPADDNISELDDSAGECVVCMSSERDTVLLPCRHLCVCATCAESLRSQCADCPICRLPFKALLRLRAVCPADPATAAAASSSLLLSTTGIDPSVALSSPSIMSGHVQPTATGGAGGQTIDAVGENVPPGYESVSLMEALYGAYAANWRKSRPSTSTQMATTTAQNVVRVDSGLGVGGASSPLATGSMATPKPTRQTPIFGRQLSAGPNVDDGTYRSTGVNLAYNDDSNSLA